MSNLRFTSVQGLQADNTDPSCRHHKVAVIATHARHAISLSITFVQGGQLKIWLNEDSESQKFSVAALVKFLLRFVFRFVFCFYFFSFRSRFVFFPKRKRSFRYFSKTKTIVLLTNFSLTIVNVRFRFRFAIF